MAMTIDEWQKKWLETAKERGHDLATRADGGWSVDDDDNTVDMFAGVDSGYHNGPRCKRCGWSTCMHCDSDFDRIPQCGEAA